jgi:hypothetical protein
MAATTDALPAVPRADRIVWLHGDHLSADNPALRRHPEAPVVFVFDEEFPAEAGFAFHRLFFLYESMLDVFASRPAGTCSLRRGKVVDEVLSFAHACGAKEVVTTDTLGGRFGRYREAIGRELPVRALTVPSLVPYDDAWKVPRRFSAWWREVERDAMRAEGD